MKFIAGFPLWFLTNPHVGTFVCETSFSGRRCALLFTDEHLARRFADSDEQLQSYLPCELGELIVLLEFLNVIEQKGFTHLAIEIEVGGKETIIASIDDFRRDASEQPG